MIKIILFLIFAAMEKWKGKIDSPERMLEAIRHYGIVPFSKCGIPGWSIEEMTPKDWWFTSSDQLGPWDWRIEVIRSGEVAYAKYLRRKAGFATTELYGHLLNWRRSQERYSLDSPCECRTVDDRLNALMAHAALDAIREHGAMESGELRLILEERVPVELRKSVGGHMEKYLLPKIKKTALEFVLQFLEMGCYVVDGDFQRVYRGPNAVYSGWQKASLTTPEALFGGAHAAAIGGPASDAAKGAEKNSSTPFWAKFIDGDDAPQGSMCQEKSGSPLFPSCTPEESLHTLVDHVCGFFPGSEKQLLKLL